MRILAGGEPADEVLLHLTEAEAREMRDKLESLLADPGGTSTWRTRISRWK